MNIALNVVSLVPGRMGGAENYFRSLVRSLQLVDTANSYQLVGNGRCLDSFTLTNSRFVPVASRLAKPAPLWYLRAAVRQFTPCDLLRPLVDHLGADVVHHPFSVLQPIGHLTPSVLTFHDMLHEFFPENFSAYALQARRKLWKPSAEQATRIIAISKFSKKCLVDRYGIDPEKISVVYHGYEPQFGINEDLAALAAPRRRYRLQRPFIYYPAATWPHKNHLRLLQAVKLLKERRRFEGQLVLSGMAKQSQSDLCQEIGRLGLQEDVVLLGYLPTDELPGLYATARLMAFPSLFEGFGIPLLEAMACGCPIACSAAASIPEVVADAALTFDPWSIEAIAETIWRLWDDDTLRQKLKAKGLERVRQFSSETTARQTIQVYEMVRR